ncbi:MAG: iron chaperone [Bacteroidia bacterium]
MKKNKFSTIDEYIALQPQEWQAKLEQLRNIIRKAAPGAEEVISYNMPGFRLNGILIWFALCKQHFGLYPYPGAITVFKSRLSAYELTKGTIKLPLNKPLPVKLISDIVKHNVKENLRKQKKNL